MSNTTQDTKERQATHTPGPWTPMIDAGGFRPFVVASAPGGGEHRITVADCPHPADALWSHQRIANARLIAAAPTMYRELELAADTFRDFANVLRVIDKDVMSAAAAVAERHIREYLTAIDNGGAE